MRKRNIRGRSSNFVRGFKEVGVGGCGVSSFSRVVWGHAPPGKRFILEALWSVCSSWKRYHVLSGQRWSKICGVISENASLLRSSGVAVVFHTFRWPFFFIGKGVRMRMCIHSYACQLAAGLQGAHTVWKAPALGVGKARTDSLYFSAFINPRRACARSVSVRLCVCLYIHNKERLFVLKTLSRTQRATKDLLKRLRSRVMPRNTSEKANMPTYRTTRYSYNARRGQFPRTYDSTQCIGISYSGYFSGDNIFVVFVVERRTMKYLPTKNASI